MEQDAYAGDVLVNAKWIDEANTLESVGKTTVAVMEQDVPVMTVQVEERNGTKISRIDIHVAGN